MAAVPSPRGRRLDEGKRHNHLQCESDGFAEEDQIQIGDGNLVVAFAADVFRRVGTDIHLVTARAVGEVAKDLHGQPAGFFPGFELFFDDLVDLIPE